MDPTPSGIALKSKQKLNENQQKILKISKPAHYLGKLTFVVKKYSPGYIFGRNTFMKIRHKNVKNGTEVHETLIYSVWIYTFPII